MSEILSVVPERSVLVAYSAACLVLFITPGPDMGLFLARTVAGGRRAGIFAMLGGMAGCCVHTLLAAIGLSALLAASATAFTALKVIGAGYLFWLAIDAVRNGSALRLRDAAAPPQPALRTFLVGLGVNLTNPKVVLFFVTFLPQFVDPANPHAGGQLVFLGLYLVGVSTPLAALMVVGAERTIALMTGRPRLMRGIDLTFAAVFGAFAVRIALLPTR